MYILTMDLIGYIAVAIASSSCTAMSMYMYNKKEN